LVRSSRASIAPASSNAQSMHWFLSARAPSPLPPSLPLSLPFSSSLSSHSLWCPMPPSAASVTATSEFWSALTLAQGETYPLGRGVFAWAWYLRPNGVFPGQDFRPGFFFHPFMGARRARWLARIKREGSSERKQALVLKLCSCTGWSCFSAMCTASVRVCARVRICAVMSIFYKWHA